MAGMSASDAKNASSLPWWGKLVGIAVLLMCVLYAVQHPHSIFYYLVKMLVIPVR